MVETETIAEDGLTPQHMQVEEAGDRSPAFKPVLHVKLTREDGPLGPAGWPYACSEEDVALPEGFDLGDTQALEVFLADVAAKAAARPGFDAVMTPAAVAALADRLAGERQRLVNDGVVAGKAMAFPTLTRRQLLLGLLGLAITEAQVTALIAALPDALQREATRIEFENNDTYHRGHPLVAQLSAAFGLGKAQVDAAWAAAAQV